MAGQSVKKNAGGKAKKPSTRSKKPVQKPFFGAYAQIWAIIVFTLAIFLFCLAVFPGSGDSVWDKLRAFHMGLWGFGAFLYPVALVYLSVIMANENTDYRSLLRFFESLAFILLLSSAVHIFTAEIRDGFDFSAMVMNEYYRFADTGSLMGSGLFGASIGTALLMISKTRMPAAVIIILLMFLFFMLITGASLVRFYRAVASSAQKAGEKLSEIKEERAILKEQGETAEEEKDDENKKNEYIAPEKSAKKRKNVKKSTLPFDPDVPLGPPATGEKVVDDYIMVGAGRPYEVPVHDAESRASVKKYAPEKDGSVPDIFETLEKRQDSGLPETKQADNVFTEFDDEDIGGETAEAAGGAEAEAGGSIFDITPVIQEPQNYRLPPLNFLKPPAPASKKGAKANREELKATSDKLIEALKSFNVEAKLLDIVPGPSVTRYELQPAPGVKISKFTSLSDDLALHLAAPAGVRIEAPIPNKAAIGIEIPNRGRVSVPIREIIESDAFRKSKSKLTVALGKDIAGNCVCADLAKMPHLLIAGTTGSGKSVCLNTLIVSLLYNATPSEVKLLLIDPKQVEFSVYNGIPHLLVPVVNDSRKAAGALGWAVTEMIDRYKKLNNSGARDITAYNDLCEENPDLEKMPQVVIIIDELSDLMSVAPSEVEDSITRLAQMARAAGMHLVVATQRPSVDVITGLIKANIPSRIALSVSSQIDSRTIIDTAGAEKLLGLGDMLFCPVGNQKNLRVQGCYLSNSEINGVVNFIMAQGTSNYSDEIQEEIDRQAAQEKKKGGAKSDEGVSINTDETLKRAIDFVVTNPESCSISSLQRKLSLGFSKAGRYMDIMEEQGIVGPSEGSKPRKVLLTKGQWMEMQALSGDGDLRPGNGSPAENNNSGDEYDSLHEDI